MALAVQHWSKLFKVWDNITVSVFRWEYKKEWFNLYSVQFNLLILNFFIWFECVFNQASKYQFDFLKLT